MTDVIRIACPGCRTLLRFEPEALDFPACCSACECRFSAAIFVRISCPNCHNGSKIREGYLGRRVRCVRCRHDFPAEDGLPTLGGGRMLVARLLDTGSPSPPETIQPFLGLGRAQAGPKPVAAEVRPEEAREEVEDSAFAATVDRLNRAVASARAGEAEALRRLEEFARVVEGLKAEIRSIRDERPATEPEPGRAPIAELEWIKKEYAKLLADKKRLAERFEQLLAEKQAVAGSSRPDRGH